eukprot:Em0019g920a
MEGSLKNPLGDELENSTEKIPITRGTLALYPHEPETPHPVTRELSKGRRLLSKIFTKRNLQFGAELGGEFVGTFVLTLVIITTVATDSILGAEVTLWSVAIISGVGVGIGIYSTSYFSNSHLNPAVTLAFALVRWRVFSWKKVVPYILVQTLAGFLAAAILYALYWDSIELFEQENGIIRGQNNSVATASVFGAYFPNPAFDLYKQSGDVVSPAKAMAVEAWATGILVFTIFSFSDPNNSSVGRVDRKQKSAVPLLIALTVAILICLYAPLTQAALNPARDFGPRLFAAAAGWGNIAIPGPKNGFWVYFVGPSIGGPLGGLLYDWVIARIGKSNMKKDPK